MYQFYAKLAVMIIGIHWLVLGGGTVADGVYLSGNMKIISWNVQGAKKLQILKEVQILKWMI